MLPQHETPLQRGLSASRVIKEAYSISSSTKMSFLTTRRAPAKRETKRPATDVEGGKR